MSDLFKYQITQMTETLHIIKHEETFEKLDFIVQHRNHTGEKPCK